MPEDEPVVTGTRDKLVASIGPGFEHVGKIAGPVRRVTPAQLGDPRLTTRTTTIQVIGTLTDQQVHVILGLVGEEVRDATKITGDQRFAVVQLGDPKNDPCCTSTVLFENQTGIWANLGTITQSH